MVAFFVRRLVGGFVTLFAGTFILFSLLIYPPGSLHSLYELFRSGHSGGEYIGPFRYMVEHYEVLKPWPSSYLSWMFDPDRGSGLLTGDLGKSVSPWRGVSALDIYGIEPVRLYSFCFSTVFFFMLIAVLQRRHRPPPWRSTRIPANARWRPAELWTTS
jgi:ABC-type dipeptide/oligopeptide/nickel transport system permease component